MEKFKTCLNPKCQKSKSVDDFYDSRVNPDGKNTWCVDCCRERERNRQRVIRANDSFWGLSPKESKDFINWNEDAIYTW